MLQIDQIWQNIKIEVESKVSTLAYDLYINSLSALGIHRDRLILLAPSKALKNMIDNNYAESIKKATTKIFPTLIDVYIVIEESRETIGRLDTEVEIPVSNSFVPNAKEESSQFSEHYRFDNFIVGKSNEYAAAVSQAVAENPGSKYNPLFIWGGVGLGKTHLMHAIGNELKRTSPQLKTIYTSSENFANELIEALRDKTKIDAMKSFRNKYRNVDVLMIDDIQFLSNKESTKEEFFHTFNELYLSNRQIIICSDRPPKEIDIEERLKTRFSTGVIADIAPPNLETRIAILQKKSIERNQYVNQEVITLIAQRITTNIREMEGMLNRIISYSSLVGGDCNDMSIVNDALKDYTDNKQEIVTIDKIVQTTCNYFGLSTDIVLSKKKTKEIVVPRQIAIYLITDMLNIPLMSIGEYFGGKDHSTIAHARDKISQEIKTNITLANQVKDIKDQIYNR